LAIEGDEWSASRLGRLSPGEKAPSTDWIGGWVGTRVGLDAVAKKIIPDCGKSNPSRPARSLVAILSYTGSNNLSLSSSPSLSALSPTLPSEYVLYKWVASWSKAFLEKLIVAQLAKKFHSFYGN